MEDDLVAWGKVVRIETRGRVSGEARAVVVGFVERGPGEIVVAAGSPDAAWALNLLDEPACRVTLDGATWDARARALNRDEEVAAVRDLILKYGTPSENLGSGPAFELRRVDGAG
jgi:deazaflavin-dependent oxidoreductase (nitroreductase family)